MFKTSIILLYSFTFLLFPIFAQENTVEYNELVFGNYTVNNLQIKIINDQDTKNPTADGIIIRSSTIIGFIGLGTLVSLSLSGGKTENVRPLVMFIMFLVGVIMVLHLFAILTIFLGIFYSGFYIFVTGITIVSVVCIITCFVSMQVKSKIYEKIEHSLDQSTDEIISSISHITSNNPVGNLKEK